MKSVNVGSAVPTPAFRAVATGINKRPTHALEVRDPGPRTPSAGGSGAADDFIGNRKAHGGTSQAVYLMAAEELAYWSGELGRELTAGNLGENVTTVGIDIDALRLGTRLSLGSAELDVRIPRIPCRTFAHHMNEPNWIRRFADRGRSGAYCAVITPGVIRPDDAVSQLSAPEHDIDLVTAFRAFMGDIDCAERVLDSGALVDPYAAEMATALAARTARLARARQSTE